MVRINWRTSLGTLGRPGLPCRTFQVQNRRKPFRCQPMTVAALTIRTLDCQSFQTAHDVNPRALETFRIRWLGLRHGASSPEDRDLSAAGERDQSPARL